MEKPLLNSQILRRIHGLAQQLKVYIYVILLMGADIWLQALHEEWSLRTLQMGQTIQRVRAKSMAQRSYCFLKTHKWAIINSK